MKIKMSASEKGFLMGVDFHCLATKTLNGFMYALSEEVSLRCAAAKKEFERKVDPFNRMVV